MRLPRGTMSLPVGVCLGDGTVLLLRAPPMATRPGEESSSSSSSSMAPIILHDTPPSYMLGEALAADFPELA